MANNKSKTNRKSHATFRKSNRSSKQKNNKQKNSKQKHNKQKNNKQKHIS